MLQLNSSILELLTPQDKTLIKEFIDTFYTVTEVPPTFIPKVILEKDLYLHYKKHVWGTLRKTPVFKEQFLQYMYVLYPFLQRRNMSGLGKIIIGIVPN